MLAFVQHEVDFVNIIFDDQTKLKDQIVSPIVGCSVTAKRFSPKTFHTET